MESNTRLPLDTKYLCPSLTTKSLHQPQSSLNTATQNVSSYANKQYKQYILPYLTPTYQLSTIPPLSPPSKRNPQPNPHRQHPANLSQHPHPYPTMRGNIAIAVVLLCVILGSLAFYCTLRFACARLIAKNVVRRKETVNIELAPPSSTA